jgi:hypothetical protein
MEKMQGKNVPTAAHLNVTAFRHFKWTLKPDWLLASMLFETEWRGLFVQMTKAYSPCRHNDLGVYAVAAAKRFIAEQPAI